MKKRCLVIRERVTFRGFNLIKEYYLKTSMFAGGLSKEYIREILCRRDAVAILPYDPVADKIVLIEQFRIGVLENNHEHENKNLDSNSWLLEIPAGIFENKIAKINNLTTYKKKYETKLKNLAKKELKEETGLDSMNIVPMFNYYSSPGVSSEKIYLYRAEVDSTKAAQFCGLPTEHEDIKVHIVSVEDALVMLHNGIIQNGITIIALQWFEINMRGRYIL